MPILNNPLWAPLGVIFTFIFGVVAGCFAFLQLAQNRKGLTCEFLSIAPIFKIASGFQEEIEIRLNGEIVRDVYLVIVKIFNSGRVSIKPEDYVKPIMLSFKKGQIINVDVVETDPENLGEVIESQDKTSVTLKNILLNSKDRFNLKLLLVGFGGSAEDINVGGRVVGVKKIRILRESTVPIESSVYVIPLSPRSVTFWLFMFLLICVLIVIFMVVMGVSIGS